MLQTNKSGRHHALVCHIDTVNIGGRAMSNLKFADDIDCVAGYEQELTNLVKRLMS